jgi:hypothetical protein
MTTWTTTLTTLKTLTTRHTFNKSYSGKCIHSKYYETLYSILSYLKTVYMIQPFYWQYCNGFAVCAYCIWFCCIIFYVYLKSFDCFHIPGSVPKLDKWKIKMMMMMNIWHIWPSTHECNLLTHQEICNLLLDYKVTLPKEEINNTLFVWLKCVQWENRFHEFYHNIPSLDICYQHQNVTKNIQYMYIHNSDFYPQPLHCHNIRCLLNILVPFQ